MKRLFSILLACTSIIAMEVPQGNRPAVLRFVDPRIFMASLNRISLFRPFGSTIIAPPYSTLIVYKISGRTAGNTIFGSYRYTIVPERNVIHYNVSADGINSLERAE